MKNKFLILLFLSILNLHAVGQNIDSLTKAFNNSHGKEKLLACHELIRHYLQPDPKKAVRLGKQGQELADKIISPDNPLITQDDYYLKPLSYVWLGKAYFEREEYLEARDVFTKAKAQAKAINYSQLDGEIADYLARIHNIASDAKGNGFFKETLGNLAIGDKISSATSDINVNTILKLAESYEKNKNYSKAIEQYEKAANILRDQGQGQQVLEIRDHIAELLYEAGRYEDAIAYYNDINKDKQKIDDTLAIQSNQQKIEMLETLREVRKSYESDVSKTTPRKSHTTISIDPSDDNAELWKQQNDLKRISEELEQQQDYKRSLEYFKAYTELRTSLEEEKRKKDSTILEQERISKEITLLKQDSEIRDLKLSQSEAALIQQKKFRNNLAMGTALLLALAAALYFLYVNKNRAHVKLQTAYVDLDSARQKLSDAEQKIKTLLHQQVSGAVARELLTHTGSEKIERKFVCVMFLDIRDFTPFVESKTPEEIIRYQNDVFGFMIDIVEKNGGVINQLLGDGFMATFGAPISTGNDCDHAVMAAKTIVAMVEEKTGKEEIPATKVGIGLHAGYVVAGNVGTNERKQYSITGNTVILAARIEQLNKEFQSRLLISEEVYQNLHTQNGSAPEFREIKVKGRKEPIRVAALA